MKTTLAIVCSMVVASAALAQQAPAGGGQGRGPQGPGPGHHRFPPPVMVLLDTDKDGILSAEEIKAAPEILAKLETSGDGVLTAEEICAGIVPKDCPVPPEGKGFGKKGKGPGKGGPGGAPFFMRLLDTDKNGSLSADEVAKSAEMLLTLDKNSDGQLTPEELRPQGGRGPAGPPPEGEAPAQE